MRQHFYKDEDKKIEAIFDELRKAFSDKVEPVVEPDAGVDAEIEAGAAAVAALVAELALVEREKQETS